MGQTTARKLAQRIARGEPFVADDGLNITGEDLRTIFLSWGTSKRAPIIGMPGTKLSDGVITPAGVIIDGGEKHRVTITGGLDGDDRLIDLSYLAGRDGGPLPPLVIRNCRIEGKLSLTGSHFAFLAIEDCEISRIDADHCQIDNHCRLTGLTPLDRRRPVAQIRMVAARIDGTADFRSSKLVAPPRAKPEGPKRRYADRLALSLASAEVAGRVLLDHGFEAIGGVSLYQATIRNSIVLKTARVECSDVDTPALDAEELRLSGSFLWANDNPELPHPNSPMPCDAGLPDVLGQIVFRRADIEGDCKFEHCRWASTCDPRYEDCDTDPVWGGIDARLARIGGQLRLGDGCQMARWKETPLRRETNEPTNGVFGASIDAWKAQIGKGVRIESRAYFEGPLFLNDTRIDYGLIMRGEISLPRPEGAEVKVRECLDLKDSRISGRVLIDSEQLAGGVTFRRARVDGALDLSRLNFSGPVLKGEHRATDLTDGQATVLDLSSLSVSGAIHVGDVQFNWESHRHSPDANAALGEVEAPHSFPADFWTLVLMASELPSQRRESARTGPPRPCLIDFRNLACRSFDDAEASAWSRINTEWPWRLLLDGIEFEDFDRRNPLNHTGAATTHKSETELRREMLRAYASPSGSRLWENVNLASTPAYSSQPFETFAKAHFSDGQQAIGVDVAYERAVLRWCRAYHNLFRRILLEYPKYITHCFWFSVVLTFIVVSLNVFKGPWKDDILQLAIPLFLGSFFVFLSAVRLSPFLLLAVGWVFKATFAFGLRPRRAAVTFSIGLLVGIAGAANARYGIVPVFEHTNSRGESVGLADPKEIALHGCNVAEDRLRDRIIYATDVFIPLIDLRQECAYYIVPEQRWLRIMKTLYELAGWVIVSMTLLTFSGVLRRDIER